MKRSKFPISNLLSGVVTSMPKKVVKNKIENVKRRSAKMNELEKYTREQLEAKIRHMVEFLAFKIGEEYLVLTEPTAKVIRTPEAERENEIRILDHMICIHPVWDVLSDLLPSSSFLKEWVDQCIKQNMTGPCTCSGCKPKDVVN
jgi:3-methyladenine DNA glycosylase AlkD